MTLPPVEGHLCFPGDIVTIDSLEYGATWLHVRAAPDARGLSGFTRVAEVLEGSRGLIIGIDRSTTHWLFVLIGDRIGWVTTDDVEAVERDGVEVMR